MVTSSWDPPPVSLPAFLRTQPPFPAASKETRSVKCSRVSRRDNAEDYSGSVSLLEPFQWWKQTGTPPHAALTQTQWQGKGGGGITPSLQTLLTSSLSRKHTCAYVHVLFLFLLPSTPSAIGYTISFWESKIGASSARGETTSPSWLRQCLHRNYDCFMFVREKTDFSHIWRHLEKPLLFQLPAYVGVCVCETFWEWQTKGNKKNTRLWPENMC